uniref:Vitamin D-binding protein n=1 Tax=Pelodiscus sinensis TaxID=13735 RepID=K7FXK5_PELSI|nr:vitamin D-binding protein [Pelodiscus sinensis]|eukprot:XP_006125482.2 vitamin D-binding protein [Pelodiscus sinensis]
MKAVIVLLLAVVSLGHAEHRGRDYERNKVCQEFIHMGKDNFRTLAIIMNSKKFSNATFEEISNLVKEVVTLAEKCCAPGADPDCYETESSALSAKSCDENAPYPEHPGIAACCTHEGLERKLCLAALQQPSKEVPTYVEPSNEELCEAFKKDPQDFADRFTHEYSSNYGQAPLPVLVGFIKSYLSMVGTCCISPSPTVCFLKERLERKSSSILTTLSNRICSRYAVYGKEKSKFSTLIMLAQKIPSASFEDISPLAEDSGEVFSKCCNSMAEDCMPKEVGTPEFMTNRPLPSPITVARHFVEPATQNSAPKAGPQKLVRFGSKGETKWGLGALRNRWSTLSGAEHQTEHGGDGQWGWQRCDAGKGVWEGRESGWVETVVDGC